MRRGSEASCSKIGHLERTGAKPVAYTTTKRIRAHGESRSAGTHATGTGAAVQGMAKGIGCQVDFGSESDPLLCRRGVIGNRAEGRASDRRCGFESRRLFQDSSSACCCYHLLRATCGPVGGRTRSFEAWLCGTTMALHHSGMEMERPPSHAVFRAVAA